MVTSFARHHLIISGTGRAGTTFLVQLLTELGLPTGYTTYAEIDQNSKAGLERDIEDPDAPYVVKSPWLCDRLDAVLQRGDIVVDHAIVPVRDLYAAAESRRDVVRRARATDRPPDQMHGGLWHTQNPKDQETVLVRQIYQLIHALAKHAIPLTLLYFPGLVRDSGYLYERLQPILLGIDYPSFLRRFHVVARPEFVHEFGGCEE